MKTIIRIVCIILMLLCTCISASASPFLTCNTYSATVIQPDTFEICFDGESTCHTSPARTIGSLKAELGTSRVQEIWPLATDDHMTMWFDVGWMHSGSHYVIARAKRGASTSADSETYYFVAGKPSKPIITPH